jgi:hypothetical protein
MARDGTSFLPLAEGEDKPTGDDVNPGRVVTLPAPTIVTTGYGQAGSPPGTQTVLLGAPVDLCWGVWDKPVKATIVLQTPVVLLAGLPLGMAGANAWGVYIDIRTSLGGSARFAKQFLLGPGPVTVVRAFGRKVSVSAFLVAPFGATSTTCSGALTVESVDPIGELIAQWVPAGSALPPTGSANAVLAASGNITPVSAATQRGYFLGCQGSLSGGTAAVNYWLMFFDRAPGTAPTVGDVPLVALGPLVGGAATPFAFDRSLRPSVRYAAGLTWALSGTADVYSAPAGGPLARVDADYGV